ncbi:hypothetical protein GCM10012319_11280 [Comamonas sp. KCTC 72670]|nr:hypothetical protein GCM10012319_11280 [Comamonas sp. KCTC 72670]
MAATPGDAGFIAEALASGAPPGIAPADDTDRWPGSGVVEAIPVAASEPGAESGGAMGLSGADDELRGGSCGAQSVTASPARLSRVGAAPF